MNVDDGRPAGQEGISERVRMLRDQLTAAPLPFDLAGADPARLDRTEMIEQADDYLLPRLERLDAPLLVVIGGSTGAGKSTITNSLVGSNISPAGVLRPTTRTPILACHPDDEAWFGHGGILPDLPRTTDAVPAAGAGVHIVVTDTVPAGLGVLDAPDIDSVEAANHTLAAQLLGAADLWLFVTTAARYADAVPWEYLARARERAAALGLVVNRIPAGARDEVTAHLAEMLEANGMGNARLFAIEEAELVDGRLADADLAAIESWLSDFVRDSAARADLVRAAIDGALGSMAERGGRVADALAAQHAAADALADQCRHTYERALTVIDAELDQGTLLRGEVLDRWREEVGSGDFMERLQTSVGRIRDRIRAIVLRRVPPPAAVADQLESNLELLIRQVADQAALETAEGWESLPGGPDVLADAGRGLDRASDALKDRAAAELDDWEAYVLGLVRAQAGSRLAVARTLSLGVNGVGVSLMIAVFSQTGGLTGTEAGIAAGTAAVSQTVLTAVFGEQAVRTLARQAREDLQLRLAGLLAEEQRRFLDLLEPVPDPDAISALRAAAASLHTT